MFSRLFCFHLFLFNAMIESPTSENVVVVAMNNLYYDDFHMRCFFSQLLSSHCIEMVLPTYDDDDDDDHFNDDDDDDVDDDGDDDDDDYDDDDDVDNDFNYDDDYDDDDDDEDNYSYSYY